MNSLEYKNSKTHSKNYFCIPESYLHGNSKHFQGIFLEPNSRQHYEKQYFKLIENSFCIPESYLHANFKHFQGIFVELPSRQHYEKQYFKLIEIFECNQISIFDHRTPYRLKQQRKGICKNDNACKSDAENKNNISAIMTVISKEDLIYKLIRLETLQFSVLVSAAFQKGGGPK